MTCGGRLASGTYRRRSPGASAARSGASSVTRWMGLPSRRSGVRRPDAFGACELDAARGLPVSPRSRGAIDDRQRGLTLNSPGVLRPRSLGVADVVQALHESAPATRPSRAGARTGGRRLARAALLAREPRVDHPAVRQPQPMTSATTPSDHERRASPEARAPHG